jgi:hypothetical protein
MLLLASCGKPFVKRAPKDKFYLYKNNIKIIGGVFSKTERYNLTQRMYEQLEDSAKVTVSKNVLFIQIIKKPIVYDSSLTRLSAQNMKYALFYIGYYNSKVEYHTDTIGKKIIVNYNLICGKPTLIDTIKYQFKYVKSNE